MIDSKLTNKIDFLFDRPWDEDISEEMEERLGDEAKALLSEYGWNEVYPVIFAYLKEKCTTPEEAVNFAHLFWGYRLYEQPIANPHEFLGQFYYRIDQETSKYDPLDILDSLATTILPKAGFKEADLYLNTQYMPENDPKILAAIEEYKKSEA